jgi:hypothetical protein
MNFLKNFDIITAPDDGEFYCVVCLEIVDFELVSIEKDKCKSCKREETIETVLSETVLSETVLSETNNNFLSKIISYFKK